ncbi:MAG TPA: DUF1015 domain-containing protein [Thermoleophilaceae bacterium]|nr:DUF1015 domain-containing protein [Thermoleophilaceae bacterium]
MAEVQPLTALHYDLRAVGSLDAVAAPPYDVIDDAMRAELVARSPFNVVEVDLPVAPGGGDPYLHACTTFEAWRQGGIVIHDREPALWPATQDYTTPDGDRRTRRGFLCRVRVEDYGPGRIRPHERTQPGPKEDRLNLTRATRANLSPIFSLYPDPEGAAWRALEPTTADEPFGSATDADGATTTIWRCADGDAIAAVRDALGDAELLIADGHHRYETARVYAEEVGGEGEHRYTLMFLCSMSDPGLTVLPTHRLLTSLNGKQDALRSAIEANFEIRPVDRDAAAPGDGGGGGPIEFGYVDGDHSARLTLKDPATADRVLAGKPDPYRRLDTALLEGLILKEALGMTEDDIARQAGLTYAKSTRAALDAVAHGAAQAAFLLRATPVEQVQEVAATGESMPPKSTFFHPKVPTGLVFNPLE